MQILNDHRSIDAPRIIISALRKTERKYHGANAISNAVSPSIGVDRIASPASGHTHPKPGSKKVHLANDAKARDGATLRPTGALSGKGLERFQNKLAVAQARGNRRADYPDNELQLTRHERLARDSANDATYLLKGADAKSRSYLQINLLPSRRKRFAARSFFYLQAVIKRMQVAAAGEGSVAFGEFEYY